VLVVFVVPCSFEEQHKESILPWLGTSQILVHIAQFSHLKATALHAQTIRPLYDYLDLNFQKKFSDNIIFKNETTRN
jgi:hypothetical protein